MRSDRVIILWLLLAVLATGAGACARVTPFQREALASPAMQLTIDPQADAQQRTLREILEAGTFSGGGPGGAGGGCGCK